jgi:hypothetical protein
VIRSRRAARHRLDRVKLTIPLVSAQPILCEAIQTTPIKKNDGSDSDLRIPPIEIID